MYVSISLACLVPTEGVRSPPEPVIDYCEPLCGCSGQPELQSETLSDGVRGAVGEKRTREGRDGG